MFWCVFALVKSQGVLVCERHVPTRRLTANQLRETRTRLLDAASTAKSTNDRTPGTTSNSQCMMPPPILDDSEDEEDDVVYDDSVDSRSRSSGESVPGIPALDGTRDTLNQSTGSTGEHCL